MRKQKIISLITAAVILISGCASESEEKPSYPQYSQTTAPKIYNISIDPTTTIKEASPPKVYEDMPEDAPWNNGTNAIMETETGFYSNLSSRLCLRYYEKKNGVEIFLCPKPECLHNGNENCVATYGLMQSTNTVLYDGNLYFTVLSFREKDSKLGIWLYRARSDGSALDAVCELCSTSYREGMFMVNDQTSFARHAFIIHKGCAFIPYSFEIGAIGSGQASVISDGIMMVDLKTGKKEQIYTPEGASVPESLRGAGDYIYFDITKKKFSANSTYALNYGTYRYSLKDGTISAVPGLENKFICGETETELYVKDGSGNDVYVCDSETGERLADREFTVEAGNSGWDCAVYDGMFFVYTREKAEVYKDGRKLGEMTAPEKSGDGVEYGSKLLEHSVPDSRDFILANSVYKISNGKLYVNCYYPRDSRLPADENGEKAVPPNLYDVYSCPIEDIVSGKGEWKFEYGIKGWWSLSKDEELAKRLYSE